MPNPRKPTALRELHGTIKDHPGRQNHSQPVPTRGIGQAPKHFDEAHSEVWDEIVGQMYAGVLGEADRLALETLCRLVIEMRTDFTEMTAAKLTQMSNLLGRFGMTPSDRTKISIPKGEKKNPFEGL